MTSLSKGDRVIDPTDAAKLAVIVDGPVRVGSRTFYVLMSAAGDELMLPGDELSKSEVDRTSPVSWLADRPLVDTDSLARAATLLKLTTPLTDLIYSLSSARTLIRAHQFKPVLKLIDLNSKRLLLADEVGLGKTIEAGLLWTELDARSPLKRVLVVCPSGLVTKWQDEMESRFDRELRSLTAADLTRFVSLHDERGDAARLVGVASYAQLRNKAVIESFEAHSPSFDLVIFDEAHLLRNPGSRTYRAAQLVTESSSAVLLLSATPVNLGRSDLFNLLHLLRPDEFTNADAFGDIVAPNIHVNRAAARLARIDPSGPAALEALRLVEETTMGGAYVNNPIYRHASDVLGSAATLAPPDVAEVQADLAALNTLSSVYTRTRRRDLRDQPTVRRAHQVAVDWSHEERDLFDAVERLTERLRRSAANHVTSLAALWPVRQAASCLPVAPTYLDELLSARAVHIDPAEFGEDDIESTNLDLDPTELQALMDTVRSRARSLGDTDSKRDSLLRTLSDYFERRQTTRVLLFSHFRLTLVHLSKALSDAGYRCALVHGGVSRHERSNLIQHFREGEFDIMLCSDVVSEGLDFEFCDVMVNYDLPWNPMKVEQRIGRLDRFGQAHDAVHIINFDIEGTIDSDVFLTLYRRLGVFEESIGELESFLPAVVQNLTRELAATNPTSAERRRLAERIADELEAHRRDIEDMNDAQDELAGPDTYIEQRLLRAVGQNRYLTPSEVERFVSGFLREAAQPARLEVADADSKTFLLQGSPLLADRLREHGREFMTSQLSELIALLEVGALRVTFSAEHAYASDAHFIGHRHPLMRAIVGYYRRHDDSLHPGGFVRLRATSAHEVGRWIFYVFELTATGITPSRTLFSVASRCDEPTTVDRDLGDRILAELAAPDVPRMREADIPWVDREIVLDCFDAVQDYVTRARESEHDRALRRNAALIDRRVEGVRRELDVHRARLLDALNQPGIGQRVRKMRTTRFERRQADAEARIADLEANRALSVEFRVVLGGLAEVTDDNTPAAAQSPTEPRHTP